MEKCLVKLTYQYFMDEYPCTEIRLIDADKVNVEIPAYIEHMNSNWSEGRYYSYEVLNKKESLDFINTLEGEDKAFLLNIFDN